MGLILPLTDNVDWIVDIRWTGEGYVADDEAKDWKADDLLASLKEGNKKANAERVRCRIPALNITDWIEPPAYRSTSHRLIWSLGARSANDKPSDPQTVNYNTYALGRNGYFELNLITDADHIAAKKAIAQRLIANLDYVEGKRYADFSALTDKVAAYGIAALVGGAVLKKTGLLATLAIILIKSWKAIALAMAAGGTGLWQRLRGGKGKADGGEPPVADA